MKERSVSDGRLHPFILLCTDYSFKQITVRKTYCTHPTAVFTLCCYGKTAWCHQQPKPDTASIPENRFKIYAVNSRLICYHSFFTSGRVIYNKYLSTSVCTARLQGVQADGSCLVDRWRLFNMRVLLHVVLEVPGNWGRCAVVVMSDMTGCLISNGIENNQQMYLELLLKIAHISTTKLTDAHDGEKSGFFIIRFSMKAYCI